jgi:hypothetical protein
MAAMERPDAADVEVVRRAVDAWNANDWKRMEALTHPDVTSEAGSGNR